MSKILEEVDAMLMEVTSTKVLKLESRNAGDDLKELFQKGIGRVEDEIHNLKVELEKKTNELDNMEKEKEVLWKMIEDKHFHIECNQQVLGEQQKLEEVLKMDA